MPLYIKSHCVNTPNEYHILADRLTHAKIFQAETIEELESFIHNTIAPMTEREYWEHLLFDLRVNPASLKSGARKTEWFKEREDDYIKAWKRHTERLGNEHLNPTVGRKIPHALIDSIMKDLHDKEEREYQRMLKAQREREGKGEIKMVASMKPEPEPMKKTVRPSKKKVKPVVKKEKLNTSFKRKEVVKPKLDDFEFYI